MTTERFLKKYLQTKTILDEAVVLNIEDEKSSVEIIHPQESHRGSVG